MRGDLRQRAEDRPGRDHRGQQADAVLRVGEAFGGEVGQRRAARGEERLDGSVAHGDLGARAAARLDGLLGPEFLEVLHVGGGEGGRRHPQDHVLLQAECVVGPVQRTRPHRRVVAHDVLVVHQAPLRAVDAAGGHLQALELVRVGPGRARRRGDRQPLHVERHPDLHPPALRGLQRVRHARAGARGGVEVVDRHRQRTVRLADPRGQLRGDVLRRTCPGVQEIGFEVGHRVWPTPSRTCRARRGSRWPPDAYGPRSPGPLRPARR